MRVHDSQTYRKMDVTRERVSRILELREILLSFQIGFNLVSAAVVCAILESISGLEPSTVIPEPRSVEASCFGYSKWPGIVHGQSVLCCFFLGSIAEP